MTEITDVKGLLIDLEGVLYSDNKLITGSIEAIKEFSRTNLKLRFFHLSLICFVTIEAIIGMTCPLTIIENMNKNEVYNIM